MIPRSNDVPPPLFTPRGRTFNPTLDAERLGAQARRVWYVMKDGEWRTLSEISDIIRDPEASISARLRDIRRALKEAGGVDEPVESRRRGDPSRGLFEYRVVGQREDEEQSSNGRPS